MYRNVLKIHFLNGQNSLKNASMSLRFSSQMLLWILWNGQKINSKLQTHPLTQTREFFHLFFSMPSPNLKEFFILDHVLWPFENCKMYRNVLKIYFLNGQNSLENASMSWDLAGRCSCEFCERATKLTLNFKLTPRLKLKNFSTFFFSMPSSNLKEFFVLDHVSI